MAESPNSEMWFLLKDCEGDAVGTWGSGNFDNDAARDHLFELTRELAEQIDECLNAATVLKLAGKMEADQELTETLEAVLPNIEIMCLLHESLGGGFLPEPESAEDWQSRFEQLCSDGSAERREVIHATFQKLRRLSQQCWEE